ncbi:MAG: PP2C family protein-serine/threonine phosphatase, partial [Caulobacteraceae bacterium]
TDDTYLHCSDGVTDMLEDREIGQILEGRSLEEAGDALMERALARGADDNLTAVLIRAGR